MSTAPANAEIPAPIDATSISGELKSLSLFLVPLAIFAVWYSGAEFQVTFGPEAEDYWEMFAVGISLVGVALRIISFGLFYDDGALQMRSRQGLARLTRYPILLSDVLIVTGFVLGTQVWWFGLVALAAIVVCYYGALNFARDAELDAAADLAEQGESMTLRTFSGADHPRFSLRRAVWNAYPSLFLVVVFTTIMEVVHDLRVGDATLTHWPSDWPFYFAALGLGCVGYANTSLERRDAGVVHEAGPQTRGLRVDGRAGLVDMLENLISAGQQEDILEATLDAAELRAGDVLVDIGCGSGKLVVAAAQGLGTQVRAIGVDATPSMITRARRRARRNGVRAEFHEGVAESLPFADGSVHAVTSSYFFHHLPSDVKVLALREMWRVLAPGGRLVITDYGKPHSLRGYAASFPMRFDFHEYVRPQLKGELEDMLAAEALGSVERIESFLGYINVLRVKKPA
jgi:ubiquinone/menaquinone biosynthesis C-methylase UbiE